MRDRRRVKGLKLKYKILIAMITCSFLIAVIMGAVSVTKSKDLLEEYAFDNAKLSVENHSKDLNITIEKIQSSVDGLAVTTLSMLDDINALQTNPQYLTNLQERIRPIATQYAEKTEGAMAFYLRFNPQFSESTSGLFHADADNDGVIDQLVPTDFSQYDPDDVAHVGWYYVPIKEKKATWLDPYHNENIDVDMISYVVPLFKDGVEVGVVGMDIRFDIFKDAVAEMNTTPSSFGALLNADKHFLIHPTYSPEETLASIQPQIASNMDANTSEVLSTTTDGKEEILSYHLLSNGFTLMLTAPKAEVYESVNLMTKIILIVTIGGVLLSVLISLFISNRLTKPVQTLVHDMQKVQQGDLTVQTQIRNTDEIGDIATSFNQMTLQLHKMATNINEISFKVREASSALSMTSEETAASVEEVTTSIDEMAIGNNEQARFIHKGAELTRELSEDFHELAISTERIQTTTGTMLNEQSDSINVLQNLIETSNKNEEATTHIGLVIAQLNDKTESIVAVLETIQTIADQTNLLALNAAIESARAGEAGKGFAIVANEIRSLANQSKDATDHIREIVADIYQDTGHTVEAMSDVKRTTTEQANVVIKVQQSIDHLSDSIQSMNVLIRENANSIVTLTTNANTLADEIGKISSISEEQATSSIEVSTIMQEQARDIEKVNFSTVQLNDLVNELENTVRTFKL